MPKARGVERRTRSRRSQGLPLRVQVGISVALVALVPSVTIALWLVPLAFPDAWRGHAPWFITWIVGLAVLVLLAAMSAARFMVGPLTRIARDLDALRASADLRAGSQIRHWDGDPREVASVKRSVLSLLQRIDEDRERRTTLLAALTHDINTSVLAARNVADLLARGRFSTGDEAARGLTGELDTLHDRTQQLIDLLRFDRVELDMKRDEIDVRPMVEEALVRVRDASGRGDVRVEIGGEATLEGDRAALIRAIENLVGNAIRHARSSVHVDIRRGAIRVSDDGSGFAASFDAMTKPYSSDTDGLGRNAGDVSPSGGMGLYVARIIAEAHGGHLVLEDTGPNGSTIGLHLGT